MAQSSNPTATPTTEEHNSYLQGYKPAHISIHAWRTAENSAQYLLPTLQAMAAANPKLRLLDCGAGPGTMTASLARYIPEGEAVAVDISAEVLARAAAYAAAQGLTNVRHQAGSVYELPYADGAFDVVHTQQMLCHLDAPLAALCSLLRVTRPGGVVAVKECDVRSYVAHPQTPGLLAFFKLQREIMHVEGGSDSIGPRLVSLALQAGVPREKITASMGSWCYSTPEEREMWGGAMAARLRDGPMRPKAIENGLATAEELDRMAAAWDEWIAAEDGVFASLNGEILITK